MRKVFGELTGLRARELKSLEKLADRRIDPHEVVSSELVKAGAKLAAELGRQLGVLIDRSGRVTHVVCGRADRVYLPDLGRFRLDEARLRQLRLIIFLPRGERKTKSLLVEEVQRRSDIVASRERHESERAGDDENLSRLRLVAAPTVPSDLITDLEKLRLDMLLVVAVQHNGSPGGYSLVRPLGAEAGVSFLRGENALALRVDAEELIAELEEEFSRSASRGHKIARDRAVLVGVYLDGESDGAESIAELRELARTAGVEVVDSVVQRRAAVDPKTVLGKGKLEDVVLHCLDLDANILIFDRELTPGQLRSVTNSTELKVLDRSMLILDIFAQRASTSEGRLQVELAQLQYSLPRLTERDSGLSRLSGGIGGRGPGETKLEIGRRRARDRIAELQRRIEQVSAQRGLRRQRRQGRGVPVVAIVGYTNAGKSTLLNSLTKSDVFVENKLFATLDPTSRRMRFPDEAEALFVDTVGFIRELPKELLNAFRATLEEIAEADLLLHVVDASDNSAPQQIKVVRETLESLGYGEIPRLLVVNKIDLADEEPVRALVSIGGGLPVSAVTRRGVPELIARIRELLPHFPSGRYSTAAQT